jgi:hypothetical protein
MWITPTLRSSSGTFVSRRRRTTLKMLKGLTLAKMRRKLKMPAMPVLKLRHSDLRQLEVMLPFLLLDLALQTPMFPLLLLHLPAAQPPPLPLRLTKNT